jgi:hypothetical protein
MKTNTISETENLKNKKLNNNKKTEIMKNTVKQIAAGTLIVFFLLAGNFKSEGTEVTTSGFKTVETSLQLESWMSNETVWNTNLILMADFAPETETYLGLESWMTSDNAWSLNNNFATETEVELELESWMTRETIWNAQETAVEAELALENWMLNNEVW